MRAVKGNLAAPLERGEYWKVLVQRAHSRIDQATL
jgi:hypothetical protein